MGCCFCHSHSDIIHDPTVIVYATVGDMALVNGPMSTMYKNHCCRQAFLYIQHDSLYYFENRYFCHTLTCKYPFTCINTIEVLRNEAVNIADEELLLNPGLQITMTGSNGLATTLSAVMPEADEFVKQLKKLIDEFKALHR